MDPRLKDVEVKSLLLGDPLLIHGTIVYVPLFAYMIKQRIIVLVLFFFFHFAFRPTLQQSQTASWIANL